MEICPYLEETFKIVGRSWNGLIINYLSRCADYTAHFSDMKRDLKTITPRALIIQLTEVGEWEFVDKKVISTLRVSIVQAISDNV